MNQSIDDIDQRMILNIEYLAQNLYPMTLPVFIRNMHITRSKDETQEFIDNADLIKYGSKFIEQWYQIYRTETQKYNVPKRQLLPKRPQPIPKQEIEEQRILTNPYRTKNKNALQNKIQDYQLKPLKILQRPYFSPKSGSYEIDLAFSYDGEKGLTAQSCSGQNDQNDQRWRQEFRASANDLQLLLIRRLQKTIITNVQDLLQISDIIDRYNQ
ncbi:MAG: hypothetical protein EZS28_026006 [Streblomastix strix]|uniref:Uncharacterized protein n=1 Tax=Streblomastix strix TaxID=222440 RepID=A0A5J4V751_9EUKA|nr:MAG: hypothetical protein EZS28_026006 [Streblomastix strix]